MSYVGDAKRAIDKVHSDTSVSLEETQDRLSDVKEHVEMLLEAIAEDLRAGMLK